MRSLRSLLITYDETLRKLFNNVYTGNSKTRKRSVSIDMLSRLNSLQLQKGSFLELARDIFLFSFYAMGMPFVDVAHLRWSQIHNDYLVYNRQKTGQQIRVAMESPMQTILFKHHKQAKGIFAFPLLLQGTDHEYLVVLGRYNRALRRLEKIAGIDEHLTSYVIRHTWASTAFSENIDLPVISKALGHSNTQTTLIYISEIDDNRVADANRRMMQKITNCNFNV
jgi:integrase